MREDNKDKYDYTDAGFNRFYRRSIASSASAENLATIPAGPRRTIRFDDQQISGMLGDILKIGNILMDGKLGRIQVVDDQGNPLVRLGDVES